MTRRRVRIVGSGLIGTSIALKLKEIGDEVEVVDINQLRQNLASDLLDSTQALTEVDFVILATPPKSTFDALKSQYALSPKSIFIDVGSVKTKLQHEVERFPAIAAQFVASHPIAGRESSGAESAQADLFQGRAWVITSGIDSAKQAASQLIRDLGATPYLMTPEEHDELFAKISHLPQMISSSLAVAISNIGSGLDLAGQGLRDSLRLAGSDGALWAEILLENRDEAIAALDLFGAALATLRTALMEEDRESIIDFFSRGRTSRDRVSGKHGAQPRNYSYVTVVIEDKPGQLAAIFKECETIAANVEDLTLEHSPRQETGLVRLALSNSDAKRLQEHLVVSGWKAHLL